MLQRLFHYHIDRSIELALIGLWRLTTLESCVRPEREGCRSRRTTTNGAPCGQTAPVSASNATSFPRPPCSSTGHRPIEPTQDKSSVLMLVTSSVSNAISFSRPRRQSMPECAKSSLRKEVAGARFDIACSCLHQLRSSLCSRARSGALSGERCVRDLSVFQAELAECQTTQQAAQVI
jgi:hypothetical protein